MAQASDGWVSVLSATELERGDVTLVQVNHRQYVIYDAKDKLYASLAHCTQAGALLHDGYFDGHTIECPLHQGCFDIRTGAATGTPATRSLRVFPVRIRNGQIELKLGKEAKHD